ncbi:hypothetical protein DPEC_G00361180 [Dallia pectoralis]|uniref:Uncharacterized protein n=1 Tax=Dallia pectoralis TaxID=75939 RepID=A0ACC2F118_DALPE|nr:hypothetical protein DPEC_G00361180 [Dallia pectoralis]
MAIMSISSTRHLSATLPYPNRPLARPLFWLSIPILLGFLPPSASSQRMGPSPSPALLLPQLRALLPPPAVPPISCMTSTPTRRPWRAAVPDSSPPLLGRWSVGPSAAASARAAPFSATAEVLLEVVFSAPPLSST